MRGIAILAAAAAMLALTACDRLGIGGGGGGTANVSANASTNAASAGEGTPPPAAGEGSKDLAAGATPASSGGVTLDRAYVVGRWTDNGDCSLAAEFAGDGRFFANNGTGGLWNLQGDQLTMTGSATLTLQIVPIDQNTMNVVNPDGSLGRSTRC
jgi:hypothetical protein